MMSAVKVSLSNRRRPRVEAQSMYVQEVIVVTSITEGVVWPFRHCNANETSQHIRVIGWRCTSTRLEVQDQCASRNSSVLWRNRKRKRKPNETRTKPRTFTNFFRSVSDMHRKGRRIHCNIKSMKLCFQVQDDFTAVISGSAGCIVCYTTQF